MSTVFGYFFQIFENLFRRIKHLCSLAGHHTKRLFTKTLYQPKSRKTSVTKVTCIPSGAAGYGFLPIVRDSENFSATFVEFFFCFIIHETNHTASRFMKQEKIGSLPVTRTRNNTVNSRTPLPVGAVGNNGCPLRDRTSISRVKF